MQRETLGRFPEMAVREHFLEQMRTYMIGGGTAMSPDSDSPHRTGQQHSLDTSSSSVEDTRERLRQQQMQQQQQQQVRMGWMEHKKKTHGTMVGQTRPPFLSL